MIIQPHNIRKFIRNPRRSIRNIRGKVLEKKVTREIERVASNRSDQPPIPLPDFLIIGAPKCGTSWLRVALAEHPEIIMVQEEIEFFPHPILKSLDWYIRHFAEDSPFLDVRNAAYRKPYENCIIGEKSARYCAMPEERVKLVHRLLPNARLVLMVRDPVERHWAHAKQHFTKRGQNIENLPKDVVFRLFKRTKLLSEFSKMQKTWSRVYGVENLLIIRQEDALAEPLDIARRVLAHLDISADFDHQHTKRLYKKVNAGPSVSMPSDVRDFLENLFAEERARLVEIDLT